MSRTIRFPKSPNDPVHFVLGLMGKEGKANTPAKNVLLSMLNSFAVYSVVEAIRWHGIMARNSTKTARNYGTYGKPPMKAQKKSLA